MLDIKKLENIFKDYPYIASAYLFGSYSSSKAGPMSDVDIALLLKGNAPVGRKLILCHNVLKTGRLIYDADTAFRIKFEMRVISNFCDFEPTLSFMERFHLRGIIKRCMNL